MTAERTTQHAPTAPATLARRRQPRLTRAWEAAVVRWRVIIEAAADRLQLQWLAVVEAVAAHGRRLQLQWGAITETVAGQVRQLPLRQWRAVIADALGRLHPRPLLLALVAGRDLERELSAVRAANVALQARALELERSNSELEQFAYMASHDLQEPLRKVASFCELLQRRYTGQLDERADQYIKFAVDGARRMQALVDDLLTFSRVGRLEPEPVLVSCASAASQAQVNLAAEIRATGAVIELDELPSVRAEFSLLTSVFQNLIGNAIKFRSDQPPVIRLSATRDEHFWLFSAADNGIGIDAVDAERIFVIFQRLHGRSECNGTGIGLAMCRKVVEHYGGRIWLDTSYEGGARFCFTLPVAPAEMELSA